MNKRPVQFVGIDVSKEPLDLACRPEPTRWRVANDSAGIAQCIAHLRPLKPALIVAKLPVAVVNPRQIRDFAKATGQLAKTEALDAGVIAHVAEAVHPTPRPLLEMLVAERQRMALAHPTVRDSLLRHIDDLQRLIEEADAEISRRIRTSPAWRETDDIRPSTPGIGPVLSATLPAALPE
jgi:transposase